VDQKNERESILTLILEIAKRKIVIRFSPSIRTSVDRRSSGVEGFQSFSHREIRSEDSSKISERISPKESRPLIKG
jgi:hypothetical protein